MDHFTLAMVDLGGHSIPEMADREVPFTLKMVDQEDHFTQGAEVPGDLFILEVYIRETKDVYPPKNYNL